MKLLIDADYIVYKCCAAAETEMDFGDDVIVVTSNFSDAMKCVKRDLDRIQNDLGSFDDEMILFFTSPNNFRKKILPDYKVIDREKSPVDSKGSYRNLKKNTELSSKIHSKLMIL